MAGVDALIRERMDSEVPVIPALAVAVPGVVLLAAGFVVWAASIVLIPVADDGTLAVVQGQDQSVRFFASDGASLGRIGGQGEGPGEFVGLGYVGWLADSLWIYDIRLKRMTILTPERELARTMRMPPEARSAPADEGRIPRSTFVHYFGPRSDGSADLRGRVAIITGGATGNGRGVYAHRGALVNEPIR